MPLAHTISRVVTALWMIGEIDLELLVLLVKEKSERT